MLSVTPVASSGVGPDNKFGYTQFTVTFSPKTQPDGTPSGISNYTGTYSYMITPDDGSGTPISSPISSFVTVPVVQPVIGPISSTDVPLRVPTSGTGGSGTGDDVTTSTIRLAGYTNQSITGIQVNLNLNHQRDGDLTIELVAPNGQAAILYSNPGDLGQNFVNTTFSDSAAQSILAGTAPYTGSFRPFNPLSALNGSSVNGTYTLVIDDGVSNNTGTLLGWSITVESTLPSSQLQEGAPMDQNADGKPDENPLTTPFTGTTPGDVYAVPTPQPTVPITFGPDPLSILQPPFNQNTVAADRARPQRSEYFGAGRQRYRQPDRQRHDQHVQRNIRPAHAGEQLHAQRRPADHGPNRLDQRPAVLPKWQRRSDDSQGDDHGERHAQLDFDRSRLPGHLHGGRHHRRSHDYIPQ